MSVGEIVTVLSFVIFVGGLVASAAWWASAMYVGQASTNKELRGMRHDFKEYTETHSREHQTMWNHIHGKVDK